MIAAAFIGPGTVTTCASAGVRHGYALLWALLYSTLACLVLQEAAARLTIHSGLDLGRAIRARFHGGTTGLAVLLLVLGGIVLGCAAYEAGNILGALSGATLGLALPPVVLTLGLGAAAALLLWFGGTATVARVMGVLVALMGAAFLVVAVQLRPAPADLLSGVALPALPPGSGLLVLGLVGTTVVPYNLFLGSALARGERLGDVRLGLLVAIPLGGLISMGILVTGTAVPGPFSFEAIGSMLAANLGGWAAPFFAFGLCAAGFSSTITAPVAAALTARGLFAAERPELWTDRTWRYRTVWMSILLIGVVFGLAGVRPIPAILLAQALNGVLLPFVAIFLLIVLNDRAVMGERGLNGIWSNVVMGAVVAVALALGVMNALGAAASATGLPRLPPARLLLLTAVAGVLLAVPVLRTIRRGRS